MQQADIASLDELAHFDAVVNCVGLGSLKLFSSDRKMVPVRCSRLARRGLVAAKQTASLSMLPAKKSLISSATRLA